MNRLQRFAPKAALCCATLAAAFGVLTLAQSRVEAKPPPRLLCGPTSQWTCVLPSGLYVPVEGTVCEINTYQQQTGAVCTR